MIDLRLDTLRVAAGRVPDRVAWADGLDVRLPGPIAGRLAIEGTAAFGDRQSKAQACEIARQLRMLAAYTPSPPASGRLGFSYRRIPGFVRRAVAGALGRAQRLRVRQWSRFPGWPLDLSADFIADLAGAPGLTFARTPVLLTHDIDSPEGLGNLVRYFLPLEESVGAASASYIVPCAWPLDHMLIGETVRRGHEIGIHGYDHSNRTPFADAAERRRRLAAGGSLARRYGSAGYRSPSLLRTAGLIEDLATHYRYDSSIPTSGGPFPVPNQGCASSRPWRIGDIWELPLTLPRDGSLRFLGHKPFQILRIWQEASLAIARSGGIVSLLTHCEAGFSGNRSMLECYRAFLDWLMAQSTFRFVRPVDLVAEMERGRAGEAGAN